MKSINDLLDELSRLTGQEIPNQVEEIFSESTQEQIPIQLDELKKSPDLSEVLKDMFNLLDYIADILYKLSDSQVSPRQKREIKIRRFKAERKLTRYLRDN